MQNPLFLLPLASTIRSRLQTKLKAVKEAMLSQLVPGSKLALSLDCWSNSNQLSFMGVLAHFINKD